ncbi:hypothetical protein H310_08542 [Aphanomyces invadans]|uniref:Uncharacterized protein n=1 Tax=Aphanomyces invadans TaxID=157072 RepID=A0A024TYN7_9STRA|nr:hypothetical protein H310_08542 [Aphanomyces invadans]ETV99133.1 hypothetical protein H310_08542 [Aphanomyces invadans]|eukprot:XP_008872561.1 hypothetical protein H310_08542 [Aphanomyces invadans]
MLAGMRSSPSRKYKGEDLVKQSQLVKVKPSPPSASTRFTQWIASLTTRQAKLHRLKKTPHPTQTPSTPTTSKQSITRLAGHDAGIPDCCRRFVKNALSSKQPTYSSGRIYYKYLDGSILLNQSTVVGGRRVPFFTPHVSTWRQERPRLRALTPIAEESQEKLCEGCHSYKFSHQPNTSCVALTRIIRRVSSHRHCESSVVQARLVSSAAPVPVFDV